MTQQAGAPVVDAVAPLADPTVTPLERARRAVFIRPTEANIDALIGQVVVAAVDDWRSERKSLLTQAAQRERKLLAQRESSRRLQRAYTRARRHLASRKAEFEALRAAVLECEPVIAEGIIERAIRHGVHPKALQRKPRP